MTIYVTRTTALHVLPEGETLYSEVATKVEIYDEAGGEFVIVTQHTDASHEQSIKISPDEWPALRNAINRMIDSCQGESE